MWPRKLLDIGWMDLAFGGLQCIFARESELQLRKLEEKCGGNDQAMVCLSVRTGFDLLLQALKLPAGSEVIMSAITIPDMIEIVRQHGLVPVPLDLEFDTLAPTPEAVQRAISQKTRLIVVAHLFGVCVPIAPIVEVAKEYDLIVVEDCAQVFAGWETIGCSLSRSTADACLYSFGPIKTATSLGGAVVKVRDTKVLARMRDVHNRYSVQRQRSFALRIVKYAAMKLASQRILYRWIMRTYLCLGKDPDKFINSLSRNFGGRDLQDNIRRRPCNSLVAILERRSRQYPLSRVKERASLGHDLKELLADCVAIPGSHDERHSYWVFPVMIDGSEEAIILLRQAGFDATRSHNLALLENESDCLGREAPVMRQLLRNIVFLPLYPEMSFVEVERMARILSVLLHRASKRIASKNFSLDGSRKAERRVLALQTVDSRGGEPDAVARATFCRLDSKINLQKFKRDSTSDK